MNARARISVLQPQYRGQFADVSQYGEPYPSMVHPPVLRSGTWLLPPAIWAMPSIRVPEPQYMIGHTRTTGSRVVASTDQGQTFIPPGRSDVQGRQCDEHMIVERRDGTLWMLVRTGYGIGESFSEDGGKTWQGACSSTSARGVLPRRRGSAGRDHLHHLRLLAPDRTGDSAGRVHRGGYFLG